MSSSEYMRIKAAARTVVLNTKKPTDSSMYTMKQRQMASRVFSKTGSYAGTTLTANDRSGNTHKPMTFTKNTGRPADASSYTSFKGGVAIGNDAAYYTGRITQVCNSGSNCVPAVSRAQMNGSDWIRNKLACEPLKPHTAAGDKPAGPVFVDDTISLNGYQAVNPTPCPANHKIKAAVPFLGTPNRPTYTINRQFIGASNSHPYKAGAATPNIPYVEKHHGNDRYVNRRPIPTAARLNASGPPHLAINTPTQGNVKPLPTPAPGPPGPS